MIVRQKIIFIMIGLFIFLTIFELVRRRKLREEYSWLWMIAGITIVMLTVWKQFLLGIMKFLGIDHPVSTLFFSAFIFILLLCIQFSVRISKLTNEVKNLAQEITLLKNEIESG